VLCCVVICCAVLCCVLFCCGVLCCVVLCCAVLWCVLLCCVVLCRVVLCLHTTPRSAAHQLAHPGHFRCNLIALAHAYLFGGRWWLGRDGLAGEQAAKVGSEFGRGHDSGVGPTQQGGLAPSPLISAEAVQGVWE